MNMIYKWVASKLIEEWAESTWWADTVFHEFERDLPDDRHLDSRLAAAPMRSSSELE